MPQPGAKTFCKEERLCRKALIEKLFHKEGSRSMAAFPLRLVYMKSPAGEDGPAAQMLVSVPKRCFKRAVKRNRVKRQVREAYRKHKGLLHDAMKECGGESLAVAFIWLDDKLWDTAEVDVKIANLMLRLAEKVRKR
jgi:ribonuclease P protein component